MKLLLEQTPHFVGLLPMVGRPSIRLAQRADKRSVFDASRIGRMASSQKTIRMEFRIKSYESLRIDELLGEPIPFLLGAIAQHNLIGLAHRSHLTNPLIESGIGAIEWELVNFEGAHGRSRVNKGFRLLRKLILVIEASGS